MSKKNESNRIYSEKEVQNDFEELYKTIKPNRDACLRMNNSKIEVIYKALKKRQSQTK